MRKHLTIIIFTVVTLSSCDSKGERENQAGNLSDSLETSEKKTQQPDIDSTFTQPIIIERFIPEKVSIVEFDTLIDKLDIQILLKKTYLQSFVLEEYEINDTIYKDMYRDSEVLLKVIQGEEILFDSTFSKATFSKFMDKEFLEIARLHNYWFRNLKDGRLEFFGVISKPETDWSFAFSHYFDLKTKTIQVEPYEEEEI